MARFSLFPALLLALGGAAEAHEVYIERDGNGPARIYLAEPEHPLPEGGDPAFSYLKSPKLVPASTAAQVRKAGYIEVAVPAGDVRAWDDNVFAPWDEEGKKAGAIYYARAGRTETCAAMPAEIVPTQQDGTRFALIRDGKPVPGAGIKIVTPDKWVRTIPTGPDGAIDVPIREKGRYLLAATIKEEGERELPGGKVSIVQHITTTTFVVP